MTSISDYRNDKGFIGKYRHIFRDPNQGLDYVSSLNFEETSERLKQQERQYMRNLIQSCKQVELKQQIDLSYKQKQQKKQAEVKLLQKMQIQSRQSIKENPLIDSLLKVKQNRGLKTDNNSYRNNQSNRAQQPVKKYNNKVFTQTLKSLNRPSIGKDRIEVQDNRVKIQNKGDETESKQLIVNKNRKQQNNRKQLKNRRLLTSKHFIKYPSSSLLHMNPDKYKQKVDITDQFIDSDDNEDDNRLKSSQQNRNKLIIKNKKQIKNYKQKYNKQQIDKQQNNYFNIITNNNQINKKNIINKNNIKSVNYENKNNKYYKEKSFYNQQIVFLKKNCNHLKINKLDINNLVQQIINHNQNNFKSNKLLQQQKFIQDNNIDRLRLFNNLISEYKNKKCYQSRLNNYEYNNLSCKQQWIVSDKQLFNRLYFKFWNTNHNNSRPNYISKLTDVKLSKSLPNKFITKHMNTQPNIFKKQSVPKFQHLILKNNKFHNHNHKYNNHKYNNKYNNKQKLKTVI